MKFLHPGKFIQAIALLSIMFLTNCEKEAWDEHYDENSYDIPEYSLYEFIGQYPELSVFSNMLKITGYNEILNYSQAFTVWAPANDALTGIDTTDTEFLFNFVKNHITRGRITTSTTETEYIKMLSGKYVRFTYSGSEYKFGDNQLINPDAPALNGLLHIINGYEPYRNNLWEFIGEQENLDSLRTYLYEQSSYKFDPLNSVEIGVNSDGQIVYDSTFKYSNPVLEKLGFIDYEDSIFTIIMPDNNAWTEAYNRIESYFNFPEDAGENIRKRSMTQKTLVNDLFYRGRIEEPVQMTTIESTGGNIFSNPGQLFSNVYDTYELSNGIAYLTSKLHFTDTSSWYKKIIVEAEVIDGRNNSNSVVFSRTSFGSGLEVSENKYILVDPTSSESSVEFSIPNVLSAKYNIYCVFVPASIVDANDTIPTKVKFILTYIRRQSGSTFISSLKPEVNTTSPNGITKMFLEQFDFEYSNVVDEEYDKIPVKLEVINDVSSDEELAGEYSRTMRIDCVIFEPVTE